MSNVVKVEINGQERYIMVESDILAILLNACDDAINTLFIERAKALDIAKKANSNSSRYLRLKEYTKICDSYMNNKKIKESFLNPVTNAYIFEY